MSCICDFIYHACHFITYNMTVHLTMQFGFRSCDIRNQNLSISCYVDLYLAVATLFLKTDFQFSIWLYIPQLGLYFSFMHSHNVTLYKILRCEITVWSCNCNFISHTFVFFSSQYDFIFHNWDFISHTVHATSKLIHKDCTSHNASFDFTIVSLEIIMWL